MRPGDTLQGTITRFDQKGRGVFDLVRQNAPDRPVAIPFTTIGDEVEASIVKKDKRTFVADLVRVTTPGPDRVPVSPSLDKYPGGLWMHIGYDAQVRLKRDMINAAFADAGHDERIETVIPSSVTTHFRNRMDYAVSWDGKIGLKEFGSWSRYRDVTEDPLLSDTTPKILDVVRNILGEALQPWDNKKYSGDLRYVVIREGKKTGERLIGLIVKDLSRVTEDVKAILRRELDALATSIVIGENPLITDLSIAQTIVPLKGDATLTEIVNGTTYCIHLNSFFQTNSVMSATLQDVVASMVGTGAIHRAPNTDEPGRDESRPYPAATPVYLLDLYCGLGFFGINLAQRNPSLHISGFEIDAQAIELAKQNAATNNVSDRCDFTSGPAEDLSWLQARHSFSEGGKNIDADIVILDPPRSGLHPRVLKTILEKKPKTIIYVSCNYHRLVEELKLLKTAYKITDLNAVDMFPHTPHVEMIIKLVLA